VVESLGDRASWRYPTFLVPTDAVGERAAAVAGDEGHHAARALRVRPGEVVRLIDGEGLEVLAAVEKVSRDRIETSVLEKRTHLREDGVDLEVAQALLKGRAFDEVVRRCGELGVSGIVPIRTSRTVARLRARDERARIERWRAVALAAVKQSRGIFLPRIGEVRDFSSALERCAYVDLAALAWEEEGGLSLREFLRAARPPRRMLVIVGPEGGFTPAEVDEARRAGATPVGLGRRVLRADWAAAAVAAMATYELGGLAP